MRFLRNNKASVKKMENVEITGNVNFKFDLEVRSTENFAVGALVALATDLSGLPVPIRC